MSDESPAPGTLRRGGRTERVRQSVVAATRAVLVDAGYEGLTVERVAEQAGVAKSTVYRRWRDTAGLLMELLTEFAASEIPLADSGSVDDDVRALATRIAGFFSDHVAGTLVLGLIAEAVYNKAAADELRAFWGHRNEQAAGIVRRAVERGDLPDDVDAVEVIRAVGAPLYYRMLVTHEPVDPAVAERAAAAALAAARAGIFRKVRALRPGSPD